MDYDVGIVKQRRIISPSNSYFSVSAAAAWTPASLSNLIGWWKGDAGTWSDSVGGTPATNGGQVKAWSDQSGNSKHLTTLSGSFATLASPGLNGLATIIVPGNNVVAPLSVGYTLADRTKFSVCGVFMCSDATVSFEHAWGFTATGETSDANNSRSCTMPYSDNAADPYFANGTPFVAAGANHTSQNNYSQLYCIMDATNLKFYVAGVSQGTSADTQLLGADADSTGTFALGQDFAGPFAGRSLGGGYAELFVVNGDVTGSLSQIQSYFTARWGV